MYKHSFLCEFNNLLTTYRCNRRTYFQRKYVFLLIFILFCVEYKYLTKSRLLQITHIYMKKDVLLIIYLYRLKIYRISVKIVLIWMM